MSDGGADGDALDLFAAWLSRREQEGGVDFETLLRDHPQLAAELAELHATWKRLAAASDPAEMPPSLQERIKSRFGEGSVPEVALRAQEPGEAREDFTSALIAQLSARTTGFGRYRIRGEVARGGMGAILKIWDEDLHRHLAMKVILGQTQESKGGDTPPIDARRVTRFLEEAQVTGQLDHPGIVPVHELGLDPESRLYFTMKLVKGRSLKEIFDLVAAEAEGWTQAKALGVLLKVCEAMAYAHDKGVIHRDLKPANVMVGKFGEVHVMDWGLARILDRPDEKDIRIRPESPPSSVLRSDREMHRGDSPVSPLYTMDGDVVGTPAYMPPEQAAGRISEVGPHSDVYALGAMLYHLLAGHPPYVPNNAGLDNVAVWALVQQSAPMPIVRLAPQTPAELVAICDKAMARDWKRRYRDMSELAADLSAYLEHRVVTAYETGTWAETKKWLGRNRALAASLAAAVLALASGLIVSFSLKRDADASAADAKHQETIAKASASLAEDRRIKAEASEQTAKEQEALAKREKENVLRLSAFQTLDDLNREAGDLWPAAPEMVERLKPWVQRAGDLLARIPELRTSLAELEAKAPPQTGEEREADRRGHPKYKQYEKARTALHMSSLILGELKFPSEASVAAELDKETLPGDSAALIKLAWNAIFEHEKEYKPELAVKALLLARKGVELESVPKERAERRLVVAGALQSMGRFDDAMEELRKAIGETNESGRLQFEEFLRNLKQTIDVSKDHDKLLDARARAAAASDALEKEVSVRRTWSFADEENRWWHTQMVKLIDKLVEFGDEKMGLVDGTSPANGWGVAKRLAYAESITERSVTGTEAAKRWAEAIEAIKRSDKYQGELSFDVPFTPQLGLLPIGVDPESGLWEFSHLATSEDFEPATRDASGKLIRTEKMGLVFVLIPGGAFWMGSQSTNPGGQNYDPQARPDEEPVNQELLKAFFLSKLEMTQGQWLRVTGAKPSAWHHDSYQKIWNHGQKPWSALLPVTDVTWLECNSQLNRLGLALPTEAQWERACRAGTSTAYSSGDEAKTLQTVGNIADAYVKEHGSRGDFRSLAPWDDGNTVIAEVGSYRGNPYGLHDMHGNVEEWCRERWDAGGYKNIATGNEAERSMFGGSFPREGDDKCVIRGGDYQSTAIGARSAFRDTYPYNVGSRGIGLRPSRAIAP